MDALFVALGVLRRSNECVIGVQMHRHGSLGLQESSWSEVLENLLIGLHHVLIARDPVCTPAPL